MVIHSDLELFLTGFLRAELALRGHSGVYVGNTFPTTTKGEAVVVRDDSGPDTSVLTKEPSIGITVLAGSDISAGKAATDLALLVHAIMRTASRVEPGNPVAAVLTSNGPYKVPDESGQPRRYMTFTLSVVGSPLP